MKKISIAVILCFSLFKASADEGTTVAFSENALAVTGALHPEPGTLKARAELAARIGPPYAPVEPRVSTRRQGGRV